MLGPMRPYQSLLLLLLIVSYSFGLSAEIYRWKDDAGNIIFSDTPRPGSDAEVVELSEPTIVPGGVPGRGAAAAGKEVVAKRYDSIEIMSPADEETIRDNVGNVSVGISIEPGLQQRFGHTVQLLFDGSPVADPGSTLSYTLPNVDRGAHTLRAVVLDKSGKTLKRSAVVRFFVHKISVLRRAQ